MTRSCNQAVPAPSAVWSSADAWFAGAVVASTIRPADCPGRRIALRVAAKTRAAPACGFPPIAELFHEESPLFQRSQFRRPDTLRTAALWPALLPPLVRS